MRSAARLRLLAVCTAPGVGGLQAGNEPVAIACLLGLLGGATTRVADDAAAGTTAAGAAGPQLLVPLLLVLPSPPLLVLLVPPPVPLRPRACLLGGARLYILVSTVPIRPSLWND